MPLFLRRGAAGGQVRTAVKFACFSRAWAFAIATGAIATGLAAPASAQVAVQAAIDSDYRLRGYSLSGGRPTATLTVAYDGPSGVYVAGSAIGTVRDGGPALLGILGNVGYARRLSPGLTFDAGLVRSQYTSSYSGGRDTGYTEFYVGLSTRRLSSRAYFSPDYFGSGAATVYGEVEASLQIAPNWYLSAHAGTLRYVDEPPPYTRRNHYDWRVGSSRQFGRWALHANVSGGGPGEDYVLQKPRNRTALVIGGSYAF